MKIKTTSVSRGIQSNTVTLVLPREHADELALALAELVGYAADRGSEDETTEFAMKISRAIDNVDPGSTIFVV